MSRVIYTVFVAFFLKDPPACNGRVLVSELGDELGDGRELRVAEIADRGFEAGLRRFCNERSVQLSVLASPAFLESVAARSLLRIDHPAPLHRHP